MEGSRSCMNATCRATAVAAGEWKKGWGLRSGGYASLCNTCGMAYEQLVFCDMFHAKESGWRECNSCGKRLHCGCIASKSSVELLDDGGVQCISCVKNSERSSIPTETLQESSTKSPKDEKANGFGSSAEGSVCHLQTVTADANVDEDTVKDNSMDMGKNIEFNGSSSNNGSFGHIKREQVTLSIGGIGAKSFSNINHAHQGSSQTSRCDDSKDYLEDKGMYGSLPQACLDISLGTFSQHNAVESCHNPGNSNIAVPISKAVAEEREHNKSHSAFQQVQRSRYLLPKPPRTSHGTGLEISKDILPHMRVARPPGEGRGRNQLLPRYWPRITDQELQQISGDSNSTIVPLFEKVLSASDAGRIGRLVLPKACAEAYFPPISQPEGLPLKIQDAKGKDWVFQFRFWPNNNSRMYVLEGVTPCIQSMQLQAGDTVTFSRIDPEGKLVMGFRKATNSVPLQDSQISVIANGSLCNENFLSGVIENLPIVSGYSGFLQSLKGSADPHFSDLSKVDQSFSWNKADRNGGRSVEGLQLQPLLVPEKRRGRNIGSKSKRLHIDNEDALELKLTWEEAQDLLRPPPSVKPSIILIDNHEFEEYEEPPVFGKRTIFTARASGGHDQWAQCDYCSKWRRLPVDVVLPSKWTCADNTWDSKRSSCSAAEEMSQKEVQNFLQQNADFRKRKIAAMYKPSPAERGASGLDALATAAALGDDASPSTSSVATTTKHPRHRPGCTCIVCIQPPSGKGPKHKPTCTCNVCMTVKRRFKTLMMRKKKRQSEREEAEGNKRLEWVKNDEAEVDISLKSIQPPGTPNESDSGYDTSLVDMGKGQIDLNSQPEREENQQTGSSRVSMMSLLHVASLPLEIYLKQNGLTSLVSKQVSSSSHALPELSGQNEGRMQDESCFASVPREQDSGVDEGCGGSDPVRSNPV